MARRELGIPPSELIRSLATRINRVVVRRICRLYPSGKMAGPVCIVLLSLLLQGCARPTVHEPVTLTLLDQEWTTRKFTEEREQELQQFTRETGIRVKLLPAPESAREKLALWQDLPGTGASSPDAYGLDVIWPRIRAEYCMDPKAYLASEIALQFPAIAASYTVDNKLVALPYYANIGLLYYRSDLLRQYGYRTPPRTWDELEGMAARIQSSERAKGKKDFWGYVWPGAAAESLTCNALEWQVAEGGGRVIESDGTISVNNPAAIRAWSRARRWISWISPPSTVEYREIDANNAFDSGRAAFVREWGAEPGGFSTNGEQLPLGQWERQLPVGEVGYTTLPGGSMASAGTLGGLGLAGSRYSLHPREDAALIRFLLRGQIGSMEKGPVSNSFIFSQ